MAWVRDTLQTLINRTKADIESRVTDGQPLPRRSNLAVLGRVLAGAAHGLYGAIEAKARQIIPSTATGDDLRRHATLWLEVPFKAATYASGTALLTGANGAVIAADTILISAANALEYTVDESVTVTGGQAVITLICTTAGSEGNLPAGAMLNLASPIAGVNATAIAASGITGGDDDETEASIQQRIGNRIKEPPHGGNANDYITWALEVPGVTRAWMAKVGVGAVTVWFVRDNDDNLIPDAAAVAEVQAYIDERRPVTVKAFTATAPAPQPLDFAITLTPDTPEVRAAVQASLDDLLRRESEPGGTILLSHIREAISLAAGETDHVLTAPAANISHAIGHMAVMGAITWL